MTSGPAPRMVICAGLVPTSTLTWLAVSVAEVGCVSPVTSTTYSVSAVPVVGPRSVSSPPPLVIVIGPGNAVASIVFALAPPVSSAASIPSNVSVSPPITSVPAPSVMFASRCSTSVSKPEPPSMKSLPGPPVKPSSPGLPVRVSSPPAPSRTTWATAIAVPVRVVPMPVPTMPRRLTRSRPVERRDRQRAAVADGVRDDDGGARRVQGRGQPGVGGVDLGEYLLERGHEREVDVGPAAVGERDHDVAGAVRDPRPDAAFRRCRRRADRGLRPWSSRPR